MGMKDVSKYGQVWGALPQAIGAVYYVAPGSTVTVAGRVYPVSDSKNDGLSPERPFATIAQALLKVQANAGDVICLHPGTHTSAVAAASVAGVTFVGLPYMPDAAVNGIVGWQPQATVTGSTGVAIAITAADNAFYNIRFLPVTAKTGITITTAGARTSFTHCMFDTTGVAGNTSTKCVVVTSTNLPRGIMFNGCVFYDASVTTSQGAWVDFGAAVDFLVSKCIAYKDGSVGSGVALTAGFVVNDNTTGTFSDNDFLCSDIAVAVTAWVLGATLTGAGVVHGIRNTQTFTTSSKMFSTFAGADMDLCLNYSADTQTGGTGGALVTASA